MVAVYFEATAIIITLVILGQMLELLAHAKTSGAIKELINLVPTTALVLRDGREVPVPLAEVLVGDLITLTFQKFPIILNVLRKLTLNKVVVSFQ